MLYAVADREQTAAGINRWNPVPAWGSWRTEASASLEASEQQAASARGRAMGLEEALIYARVFLTGGA
jgi:hypothetical protein